MLPELARYRDHVNDAVAGSARTRQHASGHLAVLCLREELCRPTLAEQAGALSLCPQTEVMARASKMSAINSDANSIAQEVAVITR